MDLNCTEEQKAAINAPIDKPVAIIACPGSGKTFTIIHRVAHLIKSSFKPFDLLVITFTRKAAQELRTRLRSMNLNVKGLTVQTFHSFGLLILRKYKHLLNIGEFRIITQREQMEVLESVAKAAPNKEVLLRLQIYKTQGQCEDELRPIFDSYNKALRQMNACDFTDLIVLPLEILRRNPEVAAYYQRRYKYALVDEMQDVSKVQFDFMKILFGDRGRLTVVGDDDQTIYSWRGADASLLLQFTKVYEKATIIRLTNCFRCPPHIVKAMSKVIQNNHSRVKKTIESMSISNTPSYLAFSENRKIRKITIYGANSAKDEAFLVASDLKKVVGRGTVAILFRTRKAAQYIKSEMAKQNVFAAIYDRARFLEDEDVNIVLNILQMSVGIPYNQTFVRPNSIAIIRMFIVFSKEAEKEKSEAETLKTTEVKIDEKETVQTTGSDSSQKFSQQTEKNKNKKETPKATEKNNVEKKKPQTTKKISSDDSDNILDSDSGSESSQELSPQADLVSASDDKEKVQGSYNSSLSSLSSSSKKFLNTDSDIDVDDLDIIIESENKKSAGQRHFLLSDDDDEEDAKIAEEFDRPTEKDTDYDFVRKSLRNMKPVEAITTITKSLNMESDSINHLIKEARDIQSNYEDFDGDFTETKKKKDEDNDSMNLSDFLYTIRTSTTEESDGKNDVHMSTIHQAKGLEWDYVYIIGASKGSWPSTSSMAEGNEAKLEEERRLFYVAMSRARKELTISFLTDRGQSMFIDEIPELLIRERIHRRTDTTTSGNNIENDKESTKNSAVPLTKSATTRSRFTVDELSFKEVSTMADSQPNLSKLSNQFVSASNLKLSLTSESQNDVDKIFKKDTKGATGDLNDKKESKLPQRKRLGGLPRLILKKEIHPGTKVKPAKTNLF